MITSNELALGKAAEHLVCADLLLRGYNAMLTDAGQPFDIIVVINKAIYTIQVKAVSKPYQEKNTYTPVYKFELWRKEPWSNVDIYALVALDTRNIAYIAKEEAHRRFSIATDNYSPKGFNRYKDFEHVMRRYGI